MDLRHLPHVNAKDHVVRDVQVIVQVVVEPAITTVPAVQVVVKDVKAAAMDVQVHAQGAPTVQQFVKVDIEVAVENVMVRVVQIVPIAVSTHLN